MKILNCLTFVFCMWGGAAFAQEKVRFATFNTSLYRNQQNQLAEELQDPTREHPRKIAAILQINRPDVVLLNEFDFDEEGNSAAAFLENFLGVSQYGHEPIRYEHVFFAPVNTGVDSGHDLDQDGKLTGTANDAFGFGKHPGQYGMLVLSRFPIDRERVRTFQKFLWKDMPSQQWPIVPGTKKPFYSNEVKEVFRLSSKSHWDVPIQVGDRLIHFLVCHPTPPVFDQDEDKNGCRNHDEIRFWSDYISPAKSEYIYDDQGQRGGLGSGDLFIIAGDLNADPNDGDSRDQAVRQLTSHELINNSSIPGSKGGVEAAGKTREQNETHIGDPANDTGDFNDRSVGNLRIDFVLPSKTLKHVKGGVFWPEMQDPNYDLITVTDHRMVWIDVELGD